MKGKTICQCGREDALNELTKQAQELGMGYPCEKNMEEELSQQILKEKKRNEKLEDLVGEVIGYLKRNGHSYVGVQIQSRLQQIQNR